MPERPRPLWSPTEATLAGSRLGELIEYLRVPDYDAVYALSINDPARFWAATLDLLEIPWETPYEQLVSLERGRERPQWFVGGRLNAADLVLRRGRDPIARDTLALLAESEVGEVRAMTYGELHAEVCSLAAGLRAEGIGAGDRVGLLLTMNCDAVVALLAVAAIGAIAVPLFSGFGLEACSSRLALAAVTCLVAVEAFQRRGKTIDVLDLVGSVRRHVPTLRSIVVRRTSGRPLPDRCVDWDDLLANKPVEPTPVASDTPLAILFTSGTTGRPKGVTHTHAGFPLKVMQDCAQVFDVRAGDAFFWPTDLGWVLGPLTIYGVLGLGATLVLYDGSLDVPSWERFGAVARGARVTHLGASPTLIRTLAANTRGDARRALPDLRVLMAAGEVLDADHFVWFFETYGEGTRPLINYSGGTEVAGGLVANVIHRPISPLMFNTAVPGVALDVFDESGKPVADRPGELVIVEPCVGMAADFWGASDQYVETYWRRYPGVWAHGDLVETDGEGSFRILGRADDTLKIAGKRTGPGEIESVALENDAVVEAAAIGVPDPVKGEALVLLVVATASAPATLADDLRAAVAEKLGRPFAPFRTHLVAELPRTRSGKVMRRLARNAYLGLADVGDASALENPSALDAVRRCAAAPATPSAVLPDAPAPAPAR
jgi:acetyl-CoA synthetase